ncbi:hypothetical protein TNCV_1118821 [Trichonephila clavipes]|uniref:Uncharacterized protein n=1 Tax=Trichonephila clavipes TaxID=2585209 RepID=A0A8X6VS60_TRICX|nr:hypothetical protein TNCV_1118821 [Trichonephila clavipes]
MPKTDPRSVEHLFLKAWQKLPEIQPLVSKSVTLVGLSTNFRRNPDGSELANMVTNDAKNGRKVAKLALPPSSH